MTQSSRPAFLRSATLFATIFATAVFPADGFNGLPVSAFYNADRLSFSGHTMVPVANVGSSATMILDLYCTTIDSRLFRVSR